MERFFCELDPGVIWRRHGDVPDEEAFRAMDACSRENLRGALEYLKKYIAVLSVMEALAGGDAPVAAFVGDGGVMVTQDVSAWHGSGRRFDRALLPLVASVDEMLGSEGAAELRASAQEVHAGHRDWRWFLQGVPKKVVSHVEKVMAR
jgi:hypothetical protein